MGGGLEGLTMIRATKGKSMDGWMDGCMDGWMDGTIDPFIDEGIN